MDFRFTILTDKSRRLIKHSRMKYISFMLIPGNMTIQNLEGLCTICIVKEQIKCTVLLLQKGVHELKETQKGIELMCHEMEKIYSAGMESGEKRGELKTQKETVLFMAEEGMDVKQIVRLVKVTEKEVQKWIDESLCVMK